MTTISTLYNANVYVNGISYLGQGEEVTLPDLKSKMIEVKALGTIGSFDLPAGLDKMSMKIKWNSITAAILKMTAQFYSAQNIMIRANIDNWVGQTRSGSVPVVCTISGLSKQVPAINLKHQDSPDIETEFSVTSYQLTINGETIFDIDFMAQVFIVDGVDQMAQYRENLGI